ncbi:MAG: helix-turn-helix domain-containing protein [Lachnospiraceae bacterium]
MGDINLQIFAERLKELRTSLNLTQVQFVEGLGITPAALSAYEKNNINPSISIAQRIAEKYNVSIDWLCGLSDKKNNNKEISTCADVIDIILKLYDIMNLNLDIVYCEDMSGIAMILNNKQINDFLLEWIKVRKLYNEKIINDDMYFPWLSNKLNSLNIEILNQKSEGTENLIDFLTDYLELEGLLEK